MTSSTKPTSVNIRVLDKDYTVACPEGEKTSLLASADLLNTRIQDIKDRGSIIGSERIAVMAALNLAHEFLKAQSDKDCYQEFDSRITNLKEKINSALGKIEIT